MTLLTEPLDFALAGANIATGPAERRGRGRDDIRLMVTRRGTGEVTDDHFSHLDHHLRVGDILVVNTSATIPAAVDAHTADGVTYKVHIASPAAGGLWTIEARVSVEGGGTAPGPELRPQTLELPEGVTVHLLATVPRTPRLWIADIRGTADLLAYLTIHGEPIRYAPGPRWPIGDYQTVFATEPGSAEMPSAGRPFTRDLLTRLVAKGVAVMPIVLHSGVSSYEEGEYPGEERYSVPTSTATVANSLRAAGGRLVAVGTTVVRALETVSDELGALHEGKGLTDLIVTPERGVRSVDGLLTGWHEPRSSHLRMLEAFLPRERLQRVYERAMNEGYQWHEFGDELLILP